MSRVNIKTHMARLLAFHQSSICPLECPFCRSAALEAENAELKKARSQANHEDNCPYWNWNWNYSWHDTDCTCSKELSALREAGQWIPVLAGYLGADESRNLRSKNLWQTKYHISLTKQFDDDCCVYIDPLPAPEEEGNE